MGRFGLPDRRFTVAIAVGLLPFYLHLSRIPTPSVPLIPWPAARTSERPALGNRTAPRASSRPLPPTATPDVASPPPPPPRVPNPHALHTSPGSPYSLSAFTHPSVDQLRYGIRTPHDTRPSLIFRGQPSPLMRTGFR